MAVLTSTGVTFSDSTSQASAYIGGRGQVFTASGTFTVPAGVTAVRVTVVGGGGGSGDATSDFCTSGWGGSGGGGGAAIKFVTGLTPAGTVSVTVGSGGAINTAGGTSSFGAHCSATGGGGGVDGTINTGANGSQGTGTSGDINLSGYAIEHVGMAPIYGGIVTNSIAVNRDGTAGINRGSGASGAYAGPGISPKVGAAGSSGIVIVEF